MKIKPSSIALLGLITLLTTAPQLASAANDDDEVKCPIVVDRQTGKYSNNSAKYRCYKSKSKARRSGYEKHSFSDDSSSCVTPTPTVTPTPGPGDDVTGDYLLSGPGEKESVVFTMTTGGTVNYYFPGGGEFEIKVMNANNDNRLQKVLETTNEGSGSVPLNAQTTPVYVKVEGPGSWQVGVEVN